MAGCRSPLWMIGSIILTLFDSALCVQCPYYVGIYTSYKYCSTSCCGSMTARTCCESVNLGVLIPAVVGGCIAAFLFFVFFSLFIKKRVHRGRIVVGPSRNKTVTVSSTSATVPTGLPPAYTTTHSYTSGPPPPPTGNPAYPSPAYPPPPPPYPGHPVPYSHQQPHPAAYQSNTAVFM